MNQLLPDELKIEFLKVLALLPDSVRVCPLVELSSRMGLFCSKWMTRKQVQLYCIQVLMDAFYTHLFQSVTNKNKSWTFGSYNYSPQDVRIFTAIDYLDKIDNNSNNWQIRLYDNNPLSPVLYYDSCKAETRQQYVTGRTRPIHYLDPVSTDIAIKFYRQLISALLLTPQVKEEPMLEFAQALKEWFSSFF